MLNIENIESKKREGSQTGVPSLFRFLETLNFKL